MQVASCYQEQTAGFAAELMQLLDSHYEAMDMPLRHLVVQSLILLRNRGQLAATELLPFFVRMFRCSDKGLRFLVFRHIVSGEPVCISSQRTAVAVVGT